ncbi:MAG: hypothetical protein KatS3mg102_0715 [Planctomycetota bacterium]|nr:MAG: hypothetical protein KatS3mg102_0715 [Planctomycetota bacterium]
MNRRSGCEVRGAPFVSVVVPCHGRPSLTRRLLRSLCSCHGRFEVILVDDASPLPVSELAAPFASRLDLTVVRHPTRRGPAAARNAGVARARSDLIAFTDNDCEVAPDWVEQLGVYLRDAPRRVAAVGGRVLDASGGLYGRYFTYHKILDPFPYHGRYLYVVTANCIVRRQAFQAVGGFDERIRHPGGEDPGLCFKLLDAGWELHYRPEAIVRHHYRLGLWEFARTFFRYGRGCRRQTEAFASSLGEPTAPPIAFGGMLLRGQ